MISKRYKCTEYQCSLASKKFPETESTTHYKLLSIVCLHILRQETASANQEICECLFMSSPFPLNALLSYTANTGHKAIRPARRSGGNLGGGIFMASIKSEFVGKREVQ
jgi:hypothetical protein